MPRTLMPTAALLLAAALAAPAAHAQGGLLRRVKQKAKERVEQAVDAKTADAPTPPAAAAPAAEAEAAEPTPAAAFVNYDFVPGERVLFADDFTRDNVGDFPRRLELKSGNMEVAEVGGVRYLRCTSSTCEVVVPLPEVLPDRFTLEFDAAGTMGWYQSVYFTEAKDLTYLTFRPGDGGLEGPNNYSVESESKVKPGKGIFPMKVMADGKYVKVYMNGTRISNAPNAEIGRARSILLVLRGSEEVPALVGNLRVGAGGKDLYDALSTEGRVATQGVYFDTGSDAIRPESAPTLKQIADMLREHGELKITIEGHTDNVGQAAANQQLSEKRAAAVKAYLVAQGIAADRLESSGYGDTKPVASNETAEGRQQNRRVELVKR
jgi:outer membrane protein OmpA-like peptidoglycan-associated protein